MSAANWMYDSIVAVSMIVSPVHQWSQAILPGLIQDVSASFDGVARLRMISLSISWPGCRAIISTRQDDWQGVCGLDEPFAVEPRRKLGHERDRRRR